jgi:D-alanyl-D-alanine carboxypeptidase/D-alanyl-D-alanine-endopeptidase (penicillin-binding protein 4)
MFKQLAIFILIIINSEIISQPVSSIQNKIDNLLSADFFQSTLIACDIYDLSKGEILYQKNHKLLLHPASNMKILTSAAGLLFLGPGYKFKTSLYYSGQIINGTLYGDLYIAGGFDPDFISSDLDSLVNIISLSGINEITGDIIGDISSKDSIFFSYDGDMISTDAPFYCFEHNDNAGGFCWDKYYTRKFQ